MQKHIAQALAVVAAAFVLAVAANALAPRQRKMALVGWYPNATTVSKPPSVAAAAPGRREAPATITTATITTATTTTVTTTTVTTTTAEAAVATRAKPKAQPPAPPPPVKERELSPHPDKPYIEIAHDDVAALHAKGVLFLDARRTSVYEQGHIPGARPFSVWESDLDDKVRKLFDERSDVAAQALPIVIYCSGGDCEDSHMLAQKLWGIQFNNLYVYKDGFPDWVKRGGAVHTGAQP